MEREYDQREELIDLGAASAETKGPVGPIEDDRAGQFLPGLTDD